MIWLLSFDPTSADPCNECECSVTLISRNESNTIYNPLL
jgi:hypothetical protein